MSYGNDEGRGEPREQTGRGHDDHDSASPVDSEPASAKQRPGDSGVGGQECAVSSPRDSIDAADETIEAEVVDDPSAGRISAVMTQWSGELPHPDDSERYEQILPGTLDRMLTLNERRMGVIERDQEIAAQREATVRTAVDAESDVKRELASADREALARGQWLSWTISVAAMAAAILGVVLGHPQALWAVVVPVAQVAGSLIRTVTQSGEKKETSSNGEISQPPSNAD